MGALSKFFFSPIYRLISIYFSKVLPETIRFMVLSVFVLYTFYKRRSSRNDFVAVINQNSSCFVYKKTKPPPPSDSSPECSICLSEYADGDKARQLRCNHVFHNKCLDKWLQAGSHATCPLCRNLVVPAEVASEHRRCLDEHQLLKNSVEEELALMLLPTMNVWSYHNSGFF
ncbi:OLC1v1017511C1 [Oldenlandia corymbosa var. corymbosa]|uniref:OLC1v1017511C1 n=1 Tax=Oldenlandia corymbosa var. corymbosa TaxID=529605 RepID=A0AAV1E9T0_OLDCO|nr:OLC1v1017511C1 [Oldenlandia corymbosa var. corymbosa]